jgi:hypothetical protein
MIILDYCLFITHSFLLIIKNRYKENNGHAQDQDYEERAKLFIASMLSCITMLLFGILYGAGILLQLFSSNRYFTAISFVIVLLGTLYFILERYKGDNYHLVIAEASKKYHYSKIKVCIVFFLVWFVPVFSFWGGLLVVRKIIY